MKKVRDKKEISLRVSHKEAYIINKKAFKLIYSHYPQMIISWIACVIWNALTPYASIYMSALIIEEISTDRNPEKLKSLVIITLTVTAAISLINAFLSKWKDTQCRNVL